MKRRYVFLIVLLAGIWIFAQFMGDAAERSSYSAGPYGVRALFLLFNRLGREAKPWLYPFDKLKQEQRKAALFVIAPSRIGGAKELMDWVRAGNRLIYIAAGFSQPPRELLEEAGLELDKDRSGLLDVLGQLTEHEMEINCPAKFADICRGVRRISPMRSFFMIKPGAIDVLAGSVESPLVLRKSVGDGELWMLLDDNLVINRNIDKYDNLRLLYQIATQSEVILFDEFHHGFTAPVKTEVKARQDSVLVLIGLLVFLLITVASVRAVRFGPPTPAIAEVSAATAEFASVLGLLYREHRAAEVLKYYVEAWRKRAAERFGLSQRLDCGLLLGELAQRGVINQTEHDSLAVTMSNLQKRSEDSSRQAGESIYELEGVLERQR